MDPVEKILGYRCIAETYKDNYFWRCTKKLGHTGKHDYKIYIREESTRECGREIYR